MAGKKQDTKTSGPKKGRSSKALTKSAPPSVEEVPPNVVELAADGTGDEHSVASVLRAPSGLRSLGEVSTLPAPVGPKNKKDAAEAMQDLAGPLAELQEKLFAQSMVGSRRSVLVLLQGMDTAGKDGVIRHVVGQLNPGEIRISSFKKPTAEELAHDFLWRIEKGVPQAGQIGVFNRSQYEDVLVVRVHDIVPKAEWGKRFAQINDFERRLARSGVTLIKCFLHVSKDVQRERLLARLDDETKFWKFNPADIDERGYWDDYQAAYVDVLRRCSTVAAPWFIIPSDKKWYRNWAVAALLHETLVGLDPTYPDANYDIEVQRQRLADE
ncbi:MAG: PPK2 family polyphosphate kinase [Nakamurella sp.]